MMKDNEIKIHFKKNSFVHPSYIDRCMATTHREWNETGQTEALRLWQLSLMFPNLEAGVLIEVVKGRRNYRYDDETLTIYVEEE